MGRRFAQARWLNCGPDWLLKLTYRKVELAHWWAETGSNGHPTSDISNRTEGWALVWARENGYDGLTFKTRRP
jgi:hypothetical protein